MADTNDYKGAPRWVKISAGVAIILLLLLVSHFFFGGEMAGMHSSGTRG